MKLGNKEQELLVAISVGDELLGILTSGGSGYLAHKQAQRFARNRTLQRERYLTKKRLEKLAKKNLITLDTTGSTWRAQISKQGDRVLAEQALSRAACTHHLRWDGVWRMVMFDIPLEHHKHRHSLRRLLCRCGYIQVQQSVYVYPYRIDGLFEYLGNQYASKGYVHMFEGTFQGNDTRLRKKFGLI